MNISYWHPVDYIMTQSTHRTDIYRALVSLMPQLHRLMVCFNFLRRSWRHGSRQVTRRSGCWGRSCRRCSGCPAAARTSSCCCGTRTRTWRDGAPGRRPALTTPAWKRTSGGCRSVSAPAGRGWAGAMMRQMLLAPAGRPWAVTQHGETVWAATAGTASAAGPVGGTARLPAALQQCAVLRTSLRRGWMSRPNKTGATTWGEHLRLMRTC